MAPALTVAAPDRVDEWTGEGVSIAAIEAELARLRVEAAQDGVPDLRTSVMTHLAWVPDEWKDAARDTLSGLAERHPSRAVLLIPDPDADEDRIDADVSLRCFSLHGEGRHVCSEVIELDLRGRRAEVPASIVQPLVITGLPVFLRWRGRPPFRAAHFEGLVAIVDRLVLDSGEWEDLPEAYRELPRLFDSVALSDIAWRRTLPWRQALADEWPEIAEVDEVLVRGPEPEAVLLRGWLASRLRRGVELLHEPAETVERVAWDGHEVPEPLRATGDASDLLSDELEQFGRDRIYEQAVAAAG